VAAIVEAETWTAGSCDRADSLRHRLLPALDAVQSEIGYISPGAVDAIARRLNVPPAEIFSVASFYALIHRAAARRGGPRLRRHRLPAAGGADVAGRVRRP
jgi:NADH:ubiquinone oxidoreductase subunit E